MSAFKQFDQASAEPIDTGFLAKFKAVITYKPIFVLGLGECV